MLTGDFHDSKYLFFAICDVIFYPSVNDYSNALLEACIYNMYMYI